MNASPSKRFSISLLTLAFHQFITAFATADQPVVEVLVGPTATVPAEKEVSELNAPFAMEFDSDGDMIIVEYDGGRIFSWHEGHGLTHLAGDGKLGYVDGPAKSARFNKLHNLAILPNGEILLSDHLNHAIRKYDPRTKLVSTLAGNGKSGPAESSIDVAAARFNQPICVSLTPEAKSLLIADINNRKIRQLHLETGIITAIAGSGKQGIPPEGSLAIKASLVDPRAAIQNKAGEIFFVERNASVLRKIDPHGKLSTLAGTGKTGFVDGAAMTAQMNGPKHLCFSADGGIFIADDNNHAIRKYDPQAATLVTVDLGDFKLKRPHGVCVHDDWLYIADSYQHRILRVKI